MKQLKPQDYDFIVGATVPTEKVLTQMRVRSKSGPVLVRVLRKGTSMSLLDMGKHVLIGVIPAAELRAYVSAHPEKYPSFAQRGIEQMGDALVYSQLPWPTQG